MFFDPNALETLRNTKGAGNRVRALREYSNISQAELASMMEYKSRQAMYRVEQLEKISLDVATRLATFLGTSPEYIMGLTDNPENMSKEEIVHRISKVQAKFKDAYKELEEIKRMVEK
jgi:transcriptional regulator with XRE-family HTH domain